MANILISKPAQKKKIEFLEKQKKTLNSKRQKNPNIEEKYIINLQKINSFF